MYAKYDVEFNYTDLTVGNANESYIFEFEIVDDNWIITKILNIQDDLEPELNLKLVNDFSTFFDKYEEALKLKISNIEEVHNNIEQYKKELDEILENSDSPIKAYSGYNATAAVSYALKWALSRNPSYKDYGDNDCTNFVSQCVYTGGIPGSSYWYSGSTAWINVIAFYNYMRDNGYTYGGDSSSNARLGDVIEFYNSSKKTWSHAAILTSGSGSSGWKYSAHSSNRKNYDLSYVYPSSTYTNIRYIKFWH